MTAFKIVLLSAMIAVATASVNLSVNGKAFTMDNGHVSIAFSSDAVMTSLKKNGKNLVDNLGGSRTFYVDYNTGSEARLSPTSLNTIESSSSRAHVAYIQKADPYLEYHIIMEEELSGFYSYVILKNVGSNEISIGELRTVSRFDPTLMTHLHNGKRVEDVPLYSTLNGYTKIQDETWQLPNGTYYSKYDLAGYIRERNYWGVFGGGYGAWIITASHEYYSGGPLKQDLLVHQDSLMLNYLTGGHFGTPALTFKPGFSKMYGPWLFYINTGDDGKVQSNAREQVQKEQAKWPYSWVDEHLYPLTRATVTGKITGITTAMVVLHSSTAEEFDLQTHGYSFSAATDSSGSFSISHVRPGNYTLTAYPIAGYAAGAQVQVKKLTISSGTYDVGSVALTGPTSVKWNIGEANRRSSEFMYSNADRNYVWQTYPPADLTFTIGSSNPSTDWYYAQTQPGTWTIKFTDSPDGNSRTLVVALAAASRSSTESNANQGLIISFNGKAISSKLSYDNDQTIYRSALQSGNPHVETFTISSSDVNSGENTVSLQVTGGAFMYDIITYY